MSFVYSDKAASIIDWMLEVEDVDGASWTVDDMKKMEVLTILRSKSSRVESEG